VMMTGRKPESLIDKSTMTWKWHQWVPTLTPWFAKILNKMLSRVPNSRYQSANEVSQALRSVAELIGTPAGEPDDRSSETDRSPTASKQPLNSAPQGTSANNRSNVPLSRGKRISGIKSNAKPPQQNPLRGIFSSPWGVALGAATAFVIVLLPLFLIVKSLLTPPSTTKTPPSDLPTLAPSVSNAPATQSSEVPTAAPSPVASPATPTAVAESLAVEVGKSGVKEGTIDPTHPTTISLGNLAAGKKLKVSLAVNPPGATMNVMAPNQANVDVYAKNVLDWEGNLPLAGEYRIELISPPGSAASNYKVRVSLDNAVGAATPTVSPTAAPPSVATPPALP
jgi:serine/threonine protein kinase